MTTWKVYWEADDDTGPLSTGLEYTRQWYADCVAYSNARLNGPAVFHKGLGWRDRFYTYHWVDDPEGPVYWPDTAPRSWS